MYRSGDAFPPALHVRLTDRLSGVTLLALAGLACLWPSLADAQVRTVTRRAGPAATPLNRNDPVAFTADQVET